MIFTLIVHAVIFYSILIMSHGWIMGTRLDNLAKSLGWIQRGFGFDPQHPTPPSLSRVIPEQKTGLSPEQSQV